MKAEIKYMLDVLQMKKPTQELEMDWYYIFGFLEAHRVSAPFYMAANKLLIKMPKKIQQKLSEVLERQKIRNDVFDKCIVRISNALENEGVNYAFLKGTALSNCHFCMPNEQKVYSFREERFAYDYGERVSNDIDILVMPNDTGKIDRVLRSLDFVQGTYKSETNEIKEFSRQEIISRRMTRGEVAPYMMLDDTVRFIEVDINFSATHLPNGQSIVEDLLSDTEIYDNKLNCDFRSLALEKFALHLVFHQYKEAYVYSMVERGKDIDLYKYLDFLKLFDCQRFDYDLLETLIKKYNAETETYTVFSQLFLLFSELNKNEKLCTLMRNLSENGARISESVYDPIAKTEYLWEASFEDRLESVSRIHFLKER